MDTISKEQRDSLDTTDNRNLTFDYIEGTPFTIVNEGDVYFGIMGKHRLTESYTNKVDCKVKLLDMNWNRIIQVISIMIGEQDELKKILKEYK